VAVRVPFHLLRRTEPAPAVGLLLESEDPADLLAACARLDDPMVFTVAGGFLVVADSVTPAPNAVRLRRLSENCYLPADADLVPALHPAEAVDLTANRGLIFRPNRPPLAFDPANPHRPAVFLAVRKPRRDDWEPFPEGQKIADRLLAITRIIPDPPIDEMLAGDGPPVGTDDARPPASGAGRRALGKMSAGLGRGIGAIGKAIGSKKLGELGDKLKANGTEIAPRISEGLLGRQEAALQHLLRKFRQGKTDDALRHAVPVGKEMGRGSRPYASDRLPSRGLFWSLSGLFGAGGASSIWVGGNPDTWRDLIAEYHKAAREASERGDFRRAALIYAKLLSDFRSAAVMLSKGGLHREAGILFRDKVRDLTRAGHEFAEAGDHEEALRLYRESHLYVEAGDLLRRIGEEDLAVTEYHKAADRVVQLRQDHVEAGDILLKKTGRADLAGAYFARGWEARSNTQTLARNAGVCAERLIEIYALAENRHQFWDLLGEAEEWLGEPGYSHDAGRFFNKVAECAELPHLKSERPEIRDRCRLGLATKLRQHARTEHTPGTVVADLLGVEKRWSPAVVSDADFALRAALKRRTRFAKPVPRPTSIVALHAGTVTAAVQAPGSGDVFVGYRDGTVMRYEPGSGLARTVVHRDISPSGEAIGLATDPEGEWVAVLRTGSAGPTDLGSLTLWRRLGADFSLHEQTLLPPVGQAVFGLLPLIIPVFGESAIGVSATNGVLWFMQRTLVPDVQVPSTALSPTTYLKLRIPEPAGADNTLSFQGGSVSWGGKKAFIGWMPDPAPGSTLFTPPLSWNVASHTSVQLAGLFDSGHLYCTDIERQADGTLSIRTRSHAAATGFRAATVWGVGKVIGVTTSGKVHWLRAAGQRFEEWSPATDLPTPTRPVACFPSYKTTELLVVLEDDGLVRVPVPG
jgi:hypothetical protein